MLNLDFRNIIITEGGFRLLLGGRGLPAKVLLERARELTMVQKSTSMQLELLPGNHYFRLEWYSTATEKQLLVSYKGPDTIKAEGAYSPRPQNFIVPGRMPKSLNLNSSYLENLNYSLVSLA